MLCLYKRLHVNSWSREWASRFSMAHHHN